MVSSDSARHNLVLAQLSPEDLKPLLPVLELQHVAARAMLQPRGQLATYAYFPLRGVASMVSLSELGETIEVATIGYEGMVGLSLFLGGEDAALEIFMQVPGDLLRMEAAAFREYASKPGFTRALHLYTQALITQIAQASACNRMHPVEQRCARWLLQSHDRAQIDEFELTHEFLAIMLGVRRASVTEVAGKLQDRGLIQYVRGVITVLNRKGLERASCACYALITRAYEQVLGMKPAR